MKNPLFPESYEEWQHFITVDCKLELTSAFIEERLSVWRNDGCEETRRFRKLYGDDYWRSITQWYEQAQKDLANRG